MTAKKLTTSPTEAGLEAEIHHAIALAFRQAPRYSSRLDGCFPESSSDGRWPNRGVPTFK